MLPSFNEKYNKKSNKKLDKKLEKKFGKKSSLVEFMDASQKRYCPTNGRDFKFPSTLTNMRMHNTFVALAKAARSWGANFNPLTMTENQWRAFVRIRLGRVSVRTVQNENSHIRKALRGVGRGDFADEITNARLGVPPASRIGTGLVIPDEMIEEASKKAKHATKVLIDLLAGLGLRIRELVRCSESLVRWKQRLLRGMKIDVLDGTKGGRPREVFIPSGRRISVLAAITAGIELISLQGRLVVSKNLKAAVQQVGCRLARVGLKGLCSAHSFRRRFALLNYQFYLTVKNDPRFALAQVCEDLGHGDQRGRWVYNSYLRATLEENKALHHLLYGRQTRTKLEVIVIASSEIVTTATTT